MRRIAGNLPEDGFYVIDDNQRTGKCADNQVVMVF